ncbi:MAG: substrate-binding domain-containing protein [Pseudomonadota bacterium]
MSLKTLAEHLGLSEATVSRALNGYPDIARKTQDRVRKAAGELGYSPNTQARRLATGSAECIGFILPTQIGTMSEPFLGELLTGLSDVVGARNWDLSVAVARSPEEELAGLERLCRTERVNGVVLSRTRVDDPRVEMLERLGFPFVTHGRTGGENRHAWFDIDNAAAFETAVRHLVDLGHVRIAHLHGPLDLNFATERLLGYRTGLANAGLSVEPALEFPTELSASGGFQAARAALSMDPRPTALLCVSDMVAIGALRAIRETGLRVGEDVSVIGYDGLPIGAEIDPALTTLAQPLKDSGRRLGEMLLAVIEGQDPGTLQEMRPASLLRRNTDGPPNGAARPTT